MVRGTIRAILLAALFALLAVSGWLARELNTPVDGARAGVFFEVEKGLSARAVAEGLEGRELVRSSLALRVAYLLYFRGETLQAGEYEFTFPANAKEVLFKIFRGRVYLRSLTVPEGLTGREVSDLLRTEAPSAAESFREAFLDTTPIADWDPRARDLEGYLFPDTYRVTRKATASELADAMVRRFRAVFDETLRRRAAGLRLSIREVVTLASLIEKETALPEERPLVSAVFHNRLRLGMKLDCDPTIIYALKTEGKYTGRLLFRDLKYPSAYNTYLRRGLPPGPICSPGRTSIEAALHPASENFLYFVAQEDGRHHFSATIGEHQEAVRNYLLKKK